MKFRLFTVLCLLIFCSFKINGETVKSLPAYHVVSSAADKTLSKTEALFVFHFHEESKSGKIKSAVKYSVNGKTGTSIQDANGNFAIKVKPGKYKFKFFYSEDFYEITTDSIKIEPAYKTEIRVNFHSSVHPVMAEKPVIYLYPQITTDVKVNLNLNGNLLYSYPTYNNGWNCTIDPDGTIRMKDNTYSYLFWDAKINLDLKKSNWNNGFLVDKENLVAFFEEKLNRMGFNAREMQDFITYWVPRMQTNEKNYVHFMFAEQFSEYAELSIIPKPDNLYRLYMVWGDASSVSNLKLIPQELPKMNRSGFTVVEWGGTELSSINSLFGL